MEIDAFLAGVTPDGRCSDALRLDAVFRNVTGWQPRLWPAGIVGYGQYAYTYDSGRSGRSFATGFAPRKAKMVLHIMPGYADFGSIPARLGPHRRGRACFYLGRLTHVPDAALADLIRAGLDDLATHWPVHPG